MRVFLRSSLLAVALVLAAASAWAQTDVALFLTPKIGDGTFLNAYRPKFVVVLPSRDSGQLGDPALDITGASWMDYGFEALYLVKADVTAAQRTALSAQTDVLVVPANIDNTVSAAALARIQATLEAANLPSEWVTTALTYRQVLRRTRRIITFMQRWAGMFVERVFVNGITLDTRWNQLSPTVQQRLRDVAASLTLDTSSIANNTTMRTILRVVADQLPDITLGGETL
jgi:hypothetical protein